MRTCKCRPKQRRTAAPIAGVVAGLLLLTGGYLWMLGGIAPPRQAAVGGPFALVSVTGETITDRTFLGRYVLFYFGYTSCQDVCPVTLTAVADAMDLLGPRALRLQPIFVTVDPQRDTPTVLRSYLAAFDARLVGLTGTPDQLHQMQQEYRVTSLVHPANADTMGYTVDHSSVLYLVGPDGHYLAPIRADETGSQMASDIAKHLS